MEFKYKSEPCAFCGEKVLDHLHDLCSLCEETVEEEFGEIQQDRKVELLKKLFDKQ